MNVVAAGLMAMGASNLLHTTDMYWLLTQIFIFAGHVFSLRYVALQNFHNIPPHSVCRDI